MLALHAAWTRDARVALWAEDPSSPRQAPRPRGKAPAALVVPPRTSASVDGSRERAPRVAKARRHPFAAGLEALAGLVEQLRPGVTAAPIELELSLPSSALGPTASPQLWSDDHDAPAPVELGAWTTSALAVSPAEALDLLLAMPTEARGVVPGDTIRCLRQVSAFALELCVRGRVLPDLARDDGAWRACWRPSLADPDDLARHDLLVRGLAPAARAAAPELSAREVVDRALEGMVDGFVAGALPSRHKPAAGRPAADQAWLRALRSEDRRLPAGTPGLDDLARRLGAWSGEVVGGAPTAFRACFRLSAPEGEEPWRLDFLLQAADDPSLVVAASEVWRTRGRVLRSGGHALADPQETLLSELGRAARIAPGLRPALGTARPAGLDLDVEGALDFLREVGPVLARAGFGVLAPPWWNKPGARLGVRMRATPREAATSSGQLGLDALCDVRWEVALGDEVLPLAELERLARLKAPLIRVRGQWVELRPEDLDAALAFYRKGRPETATAREVLRAGLGLEPPAAGLPVVGLDAAGWLGDLLADTREARFAPVAAPDGFTATLRPYQERGLGWLLFLDGLGLGACLADDMGLGKTVQLLALLAHERCGAERPLPTLLVCPMSLVGNWQREAARFVPGLRVVLHHGTTRAARGELEASARGADLVLTTYALLARDADRLAEVAWGRVVLDEAQNIKNASTRQAKAAHAVRAPRRIALTGTPVENRLSDLWSLLEFLNPGLLGSAASFRTRFAVPVERYGDDDAAARLKRLTAPFVLRRTKTDRAIVPDLPEKLEMTIACTLTREQATLYRAVVDELMGRVAELEADDPERRGAVLAAMTKLKQVCDHPALLLKDRSTLHGRSGKLARLEEILDEVVENGEKALVFTQFTEMGHPLKAHLQERLGREVLFLHGGTPRAARDAMVQHFALAGGPPVFLLSLKAGGTGLNLVAANHVVHLDRWWNPAVEDQATDRAFRIGQTRDVQVRKLVCAGTLEERIDAVIESKRALVGRVVGEGEGWLADLSTSALRELVALDETAVSEG